jgi:hypothetical protein
VTDRGGRRRAYRVVVGVLGVLVVALSLPLTIQSFVDDAEAVHRLHNVAGVFGFGLLLGASLIASARRPESIGPFWVAVASGVASAAAGLVSGDFVSGFWFTAPIGVAIAFALHPDRRGVLDVGGVDVPTMVLAALAVVPAIAFALTQTRLQRDGLASDPHVDLHHYSGMASYALAIPLAGLAASLRVPGRRVAGWIAGLAGAGLGISSLRLADHIGAFDGSWGWAAIAWGVGVIALAERTREST